MRKIKITYRQIAEAAIYYNHIKQKEGETMVTIKHEHGHYTIYVNGNFYCTVDTREEAEREKQQAEKELENPVEIYRIYFLSSHNNIYKLTK